MRFQSVYLAITGYMHVGSYLAEVVPDQIDNGGMFGCLFLILQDDLFRLRDACINGSFHGV